MDRPRPREPSQQLKEPASEPLDVNWHPVAVQPTDASSFLVQNLSQDSSYEFYVRARNIIGEGPRSQPVLATTKRALSGSVTPIEPAEPDEPAASTLAGQQTGEQPASRGAPRPPVSPAHSLSLSRPQPLQLLCLEHSQKPLGEALATQPTASADSDEPTAGPPTTTSIFSQPYAIIRPVPISSLAGQRAEPTGGGPEEPPAGSHKVINVYPVGGAQQRPAGKQLEQQLADSAAGKRVRLDQVPAANSSADTPPEGTRPQSLSGPRSLGASRGLGQAEHELAMTNLITPTPPPPTDASSEPRRPLDGTPEPVDGEGGPGLGPQLVGAPAAA